LTISARLMPMLIASRTRLSDTSGRVVLKPKYISWKLGLACFHVEHRGLLGLVDELGGKWVVMSKRPPIIAARRLESSGTILIDSRSNFTGPGFLYIERAPAVGVVALEHALGARLPAHEAPRARCRRCP
jgi:hypothetical protein